MATGMPNNLVRRVKTVRGEITFRMICQPRFDYGRATHRVMETYDGILFVSDERPDKTALRLCTEVPVRIEDGARGCRIHSAEQPIGVVRSGAGRSR